jgi:hypothetical protein
MLSFPRNTIPTKIRLIVDVKEETEIMSGLVAPLGSFSQAVETRIIGFEVLIAVTILNVTQFRNEEHAKQ